MRKKVAGFAAQYFWTILSIMAARGDLPSLWQDLKMQIYLGDDNFVSEAQAKISTNGDIEEISRAQYRSKVKPIAHYVKAYNNPKEAMVVAYLSGGYTMKAIADEFGVHYATVSRAVNQYENTKNEW